MKRLCEKGHHLSPVAFEVTVSLLMITDVGKLSEVVQGIKEIFSIM